MAVVAGNAVVRVAGNTLVLVVYLALVIVRMAIDAIENCIVVRIVVTVGAECPDAGMVPGIDREILSVMIESGGYPSGSGMTRLAIGRELGRGMRRIVRLVVIVEMTADTGIRDVVVITVMALVAAGGNVCPCQRPVIVVGCHQCRCPARVCRMTVGAGCRDPDGLVVGICRTIIIGLVAAHTGIRDVVIVVPVMAVVTICDGGVGARQCPVIVVGRHQRRRPPGIRGMAIGTGGGDSCSGVVRVVRSIIIIDVAGRAGSRGPVEPVGMAGAAQERCMCARQREAVIMVECSACAAGRMAGIAGEAVVFIPANALVPVGKFRRVIVGMAIDAAEGGIIGRYGMAVGAEVPCSLVFS